MELKKFKFNLTALGTLAIATLVSSNALATRYDYSSEVTSNLSDLVIVPYYTTRDSWTTGLHIRNNSDETQVIKFRLRRGTDSADVMDINLVLSPRDVWAANINDDNKEGIVTLTTTDNSCTVPVVEPDSKGVRSFQVPSLGREASQEGYIEVIGMGSADSDQYISKNALHGENGQPLSCSEVEENFYAKNVLSNSKTVAKDSEGVSQTSYYGDTGNVLTVSFFIRNEADGTEMGDNATHIKNFAKAPMMTNQQFGIGSGDFAGFDFPDLDGGGANGAPRGLFDEKVRKVLSVKTLANDWSFNAQNGVSTAWVINFPGQYLMRPSDFLKKDDSTNEEPENYSDLPVDVLLSVYDREEATPVDDSELVISPAQELPNQILFPYEANIVLWKNGVAPAVNSLDSINITTIEPGLDSDYGWAVMSFVTDNSNEQRIYDHTDPTGESYKVAKYGIPVLGFIAWNRTFADPNKNYGRMVGHTTTTETYRRPQ